MKDSGVKYVGLIPKNWKVVQLKYCTDCLDSERIPIDASLRKSGIYPYWGAGRIMDYVDNYIFDEKLVLLGEDGAPFFDDFRPVSHLIDGKVWVNNHIHVLRTKDNIVDSYLVHSLNSVDYHEYINGSILNKLTQGNMNRIKVPFPSITEQQAIADYLDEKCLKIDEIIAESKASIDEYKELKQSVIFEAVTKGLDKNAKMKKLAVKWIGDIPEEWEYKKIRYVVNKIGDIDHYMPGSIYKGVPYLMTGDLKSNLSKIDFENCKQVSYDDYLKLSKKIKAEVGDIIFARYASIGGICYVDIEKEFLVSYSCVVIKPKHNCIDSLFLKYYLQSKAFNEEVSLLANYNVQANVGKESMMQTKIIVPSLTEQKMIVTYLDKKTAEIDSLISEKQSLIKDLEAYKKSLIYEVVTGKRRVV